MIYSISTAKLKLLCGDECERVVKLLLEDCRLADTLQTLNFTISNPFFAAIMQLNCSDPVTYLIPSVPVDNTSCLSLAELLNIG